MKRAFYANCRDGSHRAGRHVADEFHRVRGRAATLTQLPGKAGCLTSDGPSSAGAGTCTVMRGLSDGSGDGHDVVFTSGGKMAYIAADGDPASIMIFNRNASTGALTQLAGTAGCITTDGSSGAGP